MADFLDKVKYGVDRGILAVSVKSREIFDTVKVKGQITDLRRKKRNALEELGHAVYKMFRNDKNLDKEEIETKCELITGLNSQIKECEKELKLIRERAEEALREPKALQKPKPLAVCDCGAEIYNKNIQFCGTCFRKIEYKKDQSQVSSNAQDSGYKISSPHEGED